jgi:hypothetical protein
MKTLMFVVSLGLGFAGWHSSRVALAGSPTTVTAASACVNAKMAGPSSLADAMLAGKNLTEQDFENFSAGIGRCAP